MWQFHRKLGKKLGKKNALDLLGGHFSLSTTSKTKKTASLLIKELS